MSGGIEVYEKTIAEREFRPVAMQVLAAGAIRPKEAFEYVCKQKKIESILFGASSRDHIKESRDIINEYSK
jgi:predicted aldo/keto reductase-like oxidoreductase